jgi:GNAT superfamily N-acetyltransferase
MRLFEIARIPVGDYATDNLVPMKTPKGAKDLPGGTGLKYHVNRTGNRIEITLHDQDQLVAELDLVAARAPIPMWTVEGIVADPAYQGKGLGMSLYGIALSILKLTLKAGDTQTVHGQRQWLKLAQIPGVEVQGIASTPADQFKPRDDNQVLYRTKGRVVHTFPVGAGSQSMKSAQKGQGIYSPATGSMIARWTGQ